jgi:hypothetical protein
MRKNCAHYFQACSNTPAFVSDKKKRLQMAKKCLSLIVIITWERKLICFVLQKFHAASDRARACVCVCVCGVLSA